MNNTNTGLTFFIISIVILINAIELNAASQDKYLEKANELLTKFPLLDSHNDLPWQYRKQWQTKVFLDQNDLNKHVPTLDTDIPRIKQGHLSAQFWSIYVECEMQNKDAVRATLEQIDIVHKMVARYPSIFALATTANEVKEKFMEGKVASLMGVEGGHSLDSSLGTLRLLHLLGVRYLTLTHNCNTPWAESCCDKSNSIKGLSKFGMKVVEELNNLGVIVDISHVSVATMEDVLSTTRSPVMFSHSNVKALCDHPRNVPDHVLQQLRDNKGVVMVSFYPGFITCSNNATIDDLIQHIEYIRNMCGIECVGLGSDFDGIENHTTGLEDVSKYPNLIAALLRRGWTDDDIEKLVSENMLRVLEVNRLNADFPVAYKQESVIYPNSTVTQRQCRTGPSVIEFEEDDDESSRDNSRSHCEL